MYHNAHTVRDHSLYCIRYHRKRKKQGICPCHRNPLLPYMITARTVYTSECVATIQPVNRVHIYPCQRNALTAHTIAACTVIRECCKRQEKKNTSHRHVHSIRENLVTGIRGTKGRRHTFTEHDAESIS